MILCTSSVHLNALKLDLVREDSLYEDNALVKIGEREH